MVYLPTASSIAQRVLELANVRGGFRNLPTESELVQWLNANQYNFTAAVAKTTYYDTGEWSFSRIAKSFNDDESRDDAVRVVLSAYHRRESPKGSFEPINPDSRFLVAPTYSELSASHHTFDSNGYSLKGEPISVLDYVMYWGGDLLPFHNWLEPKYVKQVLDDYERNRLYSAIERVRANGVRLDSYNVIRAGVNKFLKARGLA